MSTEYDIKKMLGDLLSTEQAVKEAARVELAQARLANKGKQKLLGIQIHQVIAAKTGTVTGKKLPDRYELTYHVGVPSGTVYSRILGCFERGFAEKLLRVPVQELYEKIFAIKNGDFGFKPNLNWSALKFETDPKGQVHIK